MNGPQPTASVYPITDKFAAEISTHTTEALLSERTPGEKATLIGIAAVMKEYIGEMEHSGEEGLGVSVWGCAKVLHDFFLYLMHKEN